MITSTISIFPRLFLIMPILVTCFWLFTQKGCELTPDAPPTSALAEVGFQQPPASTFSIGLGESALTQTHQSVGQLSESKSRSIKRATVLLRKAADALDKNERLAVRFIRQAIAILKYEVIHGIDAPNYDHVSAQSALLRRNGAIPRPMANVDEIPETFAPILQK